MPDLKATFKSACICREYKVSLAESDTEQTREAAYL